ncbi:hypothetical protein WA026_021089 [Henosepilachna vigintioctopunctata]|uniref:beta-N-acetylhexosaminidase n=1 Tax=Henosepilachna vigintioctopunctata TaxID=420089 RepID=A0AAW1V3E3_9CUCU
MNKFVIIWILSCGFCVICKTSSPEFKSDYSRNHLHWTCSNNACERIAGNYRVNKTLLTLETCRKMCVDDPIWPLPKSMKIFNKWHSQFLKNKIMYNIEALPGTLKLLEESIKIFRAYFKKNDTTREGNYLKLNIRVKNKDDIVKLELGTNECYQLFVKLGKTVNVTIVSQTFFGARHGLESLSQLIWFDPHENTYQILHDVEIEDCPEFAYRGVMVDTSRNFFPIILLKKVVDGMSHTKLNILHLHLTDSVSFPMKLKDLEWLSNGAYDDESLYTEEDIEDLIQYSTLRGVKLILEIDAPSHVSAGWHFHPTLSDLVICDEEDILNGHLNPDNEESLNILQNIYRNLLNLMHNDDIFHIGGDEVNLRCLETTKTARNFSDMITFWANYTNVLFERLKLANNNKLPKNVIMWSSPLTDSYDGLNYLNHKENIIVQFWFGNSYLFLAKQFRVIFSTVGYWYLDCGFGPWKPSQVHGVCDPFKNWQKAYEYRPWESKYIKSLTEGGEVCLWSEQVAEESLETRIWPRAAAFAERMWSDPPELNNNTYVRLDNLRESMRSRGIKVSAIWPRWCSINPGSCQ